MKRWVVAVAVGLILFGLSKAVIGQSSPPAAIPADAQPANASNVQSQNPNNNAQKPPSIPPVVTGNTDKAQATGDAQDSKQKDSWLVVWVCNLWDRFWSDFIYPLTACLVVIGWWQIRVTRNIAKRQLRAYVSISEIKNLGLSSCLVVIKNYGQTPASFVIGQGMISTMANPLPRNFVVAPLDLSPPSPLNPDKQIGSLTLCPQGEYEFPCVRGGERQEWAKRWDSYLSGRIEYVDIFGGKRWTTFFYIMKRRIPHGVFLVPAERGNETDYNKEKNQSRSPNGPPPVKGVETSPHSLPHPPS